MRFADSLAMFRGLLPPFARQIVVPGAGAHSIRLTDHPAPGIFCPMLHLIAPYALASFYFTCAT